MAFERPHNYFLRAYVWLVLCFLLQRETAQNVSTTKGLFDKQSRIELATIPSLLSYAEEIKEDWEKLGLEVKVKSVFSLDEFEALLITQEVPVDPDQYLLWHSTQKMNISGYKSPKIDNLLEEGRKTLDQEKRKEAYLDFQRFLVEDTPAIFLFHPTLYTVSRN